MPCATDPSRHLVRGQRELTVKVHIFLLQWWRARKQKVPQPTTTSGTSRSWNSGTRAGMQEKGSSLQCIVGPQAYLPDHLQGQWKEIIIFPAKPEIWVLDSGGVNKN